MISNTQRNIATTTWPGSMPEQRDDLARMEAAILGGVTAVDACEVVDADAAVTLCLSLFRTCPPEHRQAITRMISKEPVLQCAMRRLDDDNEWESRVDLQVLLDWSGAFRSCEGQHSPHAVRALEDAGELLPARYSVGASGNSRQVMQGPLNQLQQAFMDGPDAVEACEVVDADEALVLCTTTDRDAPGVCDAEIKVLLNKRVVKAHVLGLLARPDAGTRFPRLRAFAVRFGLLSAG